MIEFNAIVLLGRDPGFVRDGALTGDQRFIELRIEDTERISQADRRYGRRGDPSRIRDRFSHGLRFFAVEEAQGLVAWFWVAHNCPRYFDELCWQLDLGATHAWGRDAFVAPERRGRRVLTAMMDLAATLDERPVRYLSDVSASNFISLRAHKSLGFKRLATVSSLALGKRLLIRSRPPECIPYPRAIRPERRWLRLSPEELQWHRAHIA
ncbi:MAG: GNAT family N-acetyltransferase [Pseudoxanthomonas sp.]